MNISVKHVSACAVSALFVLAAGMTVPAATAQVQKITWENCPSMVTTEGAQCGHIEVPMDYSNPAGEKISVGIKEQSVGRCSSIQVAPAAMCMDTQQVKLVLRGLRRCGRNGI